jgi:Fe-S oxidoreductase
MAQKNIRYLSSVVPPDTIIVGIEPSTILSFRDEYLDFNFDSTTRTLAKSIGKQVYTIEEFIYSEFKKGNITRELFTNERKDILVHIHCQFKAIADKSIVLNILQIPANYKVTEISSGCCGMAGSFGFEKEHYDLSMKIGELKLFPAIRNAKNDTIIVANGTSCRQQILEGTQVKALHPIEVLYKALI